MGPGACLGLGTGIALLGTGIVLPPTHPVPTTPGTPSPPSKSAGPSAVVSQLVNSAVGLKSVGQLSLRAQISDIRVMTEVYNLVYIGRINNHLYIAGNE